jgi:hypothetical protein
MIFHDDLYYRCLTQTSTVSLWNLHCNGFKVRGNGRKKTSQFVALNTSPSVSSFWMDLKRGLSVILGNDLVTHNAHWHYIAISNDLLQLQGLCWGIYKGVWEIHFKVLEKPASQFSVTTLKANRRPLDCLAIPVYDINPSAVTWVWLK